jgi:sugar transferase (PEP-CTERM/EpsH1 system associated)
VKVAYLAHRIPYPPNKGDKIRSFNEVKYLSRSHEVDVLCLADNPSDLTYQNDLRDYCRRVYVQPLNPSIARIKSVASPLRGKPLSVGYFYSGKLQTVCNEWLSSETYEAIICFSSPMAEYLFRCPLLKERFSSNPGPRTLDPGPALVMDFCDVDSDKWRQYAREAPFPLRVVYSMESKLLLRYEKRINLSFDFSVFVSQGEADLFKRLFPEARNVQVIPNGVDHDYFSPGHGASNAERGTGNPQPVMLFTGAMDYYANVDGVCWFCKEVFPLIKKEFPETLLYIVGSNPVGAVKDLERIDGVKVTGFVEDIRSYYATADVCVIPLRLARGVQNKVLEAMSMARLVIASSRAIQGIHAVPGEHLMVADTPQEIASTVSRLLSDGEKRRDLGGRAREFVMERHSWARNMEAFDSIVRGQ